MHSWATKIDDTQGEDKETPRVLANDDVSRAGPKTIWIWMITPKSKQMGSCQN